LCSTSFVQKSKIIDHLSKGHDDPSEKPTNEFIRKIKQFYQNILQHAQNPMLMADPLRNLFDEITTRCT